MNLKNHKKEITLIVLALVLILILLFFARFQIEKYPGLVPAAKNFVQVYGLKAGFLIAMLGSFWFFPFPYEIILGPMIKLYNPFFIAITVFALGASIADIVNFYSGRILGKKFIEKKVRVETFRSIKNFFRKYGIATLVLFGFIGSVTSYDLAVFVIGGFSEMEFKKFIPITIICRIINFAVIFLIADFLIKIVLV